MNRSFLCLVLAALLALPILGCGSDRGAGPADSQTRGVAGNLGTDANGTPYVGADVCINCHKDPTSASGPIQSLISSQNLPPFTQEPNLVQNYLASPHVVHSTSINAQSGSSCLQCHDPVGDAKTIAPLLTPADVPAQGLAAVTCEACHGAGGKHYGLGPIPDATPDYTVCGKCHNQSMPQSHSAQHPFGVDILENYEASAHFQSINSQVQTTPGGAVQALCARCHTDQGFREYAAATQGMTASELGTALGGDPALTSVGPVQCRTCHDPHSGKLRTKAVTALESDTVDNNGQPISPPKAITVTEYSASFELCTTCHQVFLTATFDPASNTFSYQLDPNKIDQGMHASINQFADTHFDNPNTAQVEGYNINAADPRACLNCHDPHGTTKFTQPNASTIATAWAQTPGSHGDYQAKAFWYPQGSACAKCHSGSEFVKITAGLPYSTTNADGSLTYNLSPNQARVVACGSCHNLTAKDSSGNFSLGPRRVFKTAAGTTTTTFTFPSGTTADLSAAPDNMLCLTCHSGRESASAVDAVIAAGPRADGTYPFVDVHHFAAGATFYGAQAHGGYEYPGKSYAGPFAHPNQNLATCIECHMGDSENHSFVPDLGTCEFCHGGTSFDTLVAPATLKATIDTLKAQLLSLLQGQGVSHSANYPYFSNITTSQQLKAAYNWQFADQDPACYIHNGVYVEQLLYDSIADLGGTTSVSRPN